MISLWFRWQPVRGGMLVALLAVACATGCGSPAAQFKSNLVYTLGEEKKAGSKLGDREADIDAALGALFGTPDEPHVPALADVEVSQVLDVQGLRLAAGPVGRDERGNIRGLYREHCAHCHGISGDGRGPTAAFLNPYPRDFRPAIYKFKSTPVGTPPTHDDLKKTIIEGIPGTAMPSFKLLPNVEIDALVDYVKYLSIRGETERSLVSTTLNDLDESERLFDISLEKSEKTEDQEKFQGQLELIKGAAADPFTKWIGAAEAVVEVPKRPSGFDREKSIERGREIFYTVANCNKCHGDAALGDGQTDIYDKWTEELLPKDPKAVRDFLAVGALEPRNIRPRNLRQGVYRGGRRPIDIYWRLYNGIDGSGMPGVKDSVLSPDAEPDPKKLTQDDVWHLVEYVRSLPYEHVSRPSDTFPSFQRDRN